MRRDVKNKKEKSPAPRNYAENRGFLTGADRRTFEGCATHGETVHRTVSSKSRFGVLFGGSSPLFFANKKRGANASRFWS